MNKKYELPSWLFGDEKYNLCLTDDIDSLFSCIVLQQLKGWEIKAFYDFNNMYVIDGIKENMVGVDLDLNNGICFSNHVTKISKDDIVNPYAVNINNYENICSDNYIYKYAGSTLLTVLGVFDANLSCLTEKQLMTLLCIDSAFLGFYYNNSTIRQAHKHFMADILEFPMLLEVEQKHKQEDFYNLINEYRLKGKIQVVDGQLQTNINLQGLEDLFGLPFALPQDQFKTIGTLKNNFSNLYNISNKADIGGNLFSLAVTTKRTIKYTTIA